MSASEKLKQLDSEATARPWGVALINNRTWGVTSHDGAIDIGDMDSEESARLFVILRNILPEIIAMVEAAEDEVANAQLVADEEISLDRALVALDAKLGQ